MYPLIKISEIGKEVNFFAVVLTSAFKNTILQLLDSICFRMISTLNLFNVEYYEYHFRKKEEQGLTIGE